MTWLDDDGKKCVKRREEWKLRELDDENYHKSNTKTRRIIHKNVVIFFFFRVLLKEI